MSKSFLGRADLPLGLRLNNPGNLIITADRWKGGIYPGNHNRFVTFENILFGLRAKFIDILGDIIKGANTPTKLITQYAPPNENQTQVYINNVSRALGIGPNDKIPFNESSILKLSRAILNQENGQSYAALISDQDLKDALKLVPAEKKNFNKVVAITGVSLILVVLGYLLLTSE